MLIPTFRRPAALAVTLATLLPQTFRDFRVVVSDQGDPPGVGSSGEVQAVVRVLRQRGHAVELHHHLPRRGLAEHRAYLLAQARAPLGLFLDDDLILEPDLVERLVRVIRAERCGFAGCGLIGMSHEGDERPHEQGIEFWDGPVRPERVEPGSRAWYRHRLHNAANLLHLRRRLRPAPGTARPYRVAWVGGCVLYDLGVLRAVGGFDFWRELPPDHAGEDVLAQLRVMAAAGGCGVFPSGAYHQELATTVTERAVDAPRALPVHAPGEA